VEPPPPHDDATGHFARPASVIAVRPETLLQDTHARKSATVEITDPEDRTARIRLPDDEAVIGRDPDCAVPLPFANISRRHARMFRQGEEHILEDLESTNGTYVNGVRISRCILHDGDLIQIGKARLHFAYRKAPPAAP
jgi:pSer/pThr/pTyr-binding forkhead associated (FHA) protein